MQLLTLADAGRLYSANATRSRTDRVTNETNGPVIISGAINDEELTVSMRFLDSGNTLLERKCARLDDREFRTVGNIPGHAHGFCDVFPGETKEGLKFVIESHRRYQVDPQGNAPALKRFYRHVLICLELSHTNIVPFLGVFSSARFPYACVFESVGDKNLPEYLVSNPGVSRLKLLLEVARGLHHTHDLDIVHGSIRGSNVRIDDKGTAKIAGFASATLSNIASEDTDEPIEPRWCSPEILYPNAFGLAKAKATKASDMYAFGMLAYEIFSGQIPFHDRQGPAVVVAVITTDERLPRPGHRELSDQLWGMIELCWQREPSQRPTIQEVATILEG